MSNYPGFNYQVKGPAGAPWVTFIPGIGNDATFWLQQAEALSTAFQVLTFDPWGHAGSPPPPKECHFADIVAGVIQLWDTLSITTSAVVGLGFGGSTALALGLNYPDRLSKIIACACRPRQPDNRRDFWRERIETAQHGKFDKLCDVTVDRWLSEDFRAAHPEVDQNLRAMIKRTSVSGYVAYVTAFIEMDFSQRLSELSLPTVLVAAEHDHGGGPASDMLEMSKQIPGAAFELVRKSGHILNHEQPELINALLKHHLST